MRTLWRDDVLFPSGIHPGIVTLPAALAIGEVKQASGRDLLTSIVLGYEVLGKLGTVAYGWGAPMPRRPTMIFGGYGPVTVAGRLLQLDRERMSNALGYAAHLGLGVPEGGQTDHFYSFFSANGVLACQLAAAGGKPYSKTTLEGELGLFKSYFGKTPVSLGSEIERMGKDWEILRAEYKRHHGTGANTVAIELLLSMLKTHRISHSRIVKVNVFLAAEREGRKENSFRGPFVDPGAAYSSLPYALAVVMLYGKVVPAHYTSEAIRNPALLDIVSRIEPVFEKGHKNRRYCRLEIMTDDRRKLVGTSEGFMFPFPASMWKSWLIENGTGVLPLHKLELLSSLLADLQDLKSVSTLMSAARK
jgi:2-methylcitrate dehydratase PrpD